MAVGASALFLGRRRSPSVARVMKAQNLFGVWGRRLTATMSSSESIEALDRNELIARIGQVSRQPAQIAQVQYAAQPRESAQWRRHLRRP